jgi:hypothetical protein
MYSTALPYPALIFYYSTLFPVVKQKIKKMQYFFRIPCYTTGKDSYMDWHTTSLSDLEALQRCALGNGFFANNYSAVNSLLYAGKFHSQLAMENGWLFEKFRVNGKTHFSVPHRIAGPAADGEEAKAAVAALATDAARSGEALSFSNIPPEEKEFLLSLYPSAQVEATPESADYIYRTQDLAGLAGKKYSRKRNHIHQFRNKYPDYVFAPLSPEGIGSVRQLEESWLAESGGESADLQIEKDIIFSALDAFGQLSTQCGMTGGILSVSGRPVAFCIASILSGSVTDVHFEKCLSSYARDGGYAVINNEFAKTVRTEFINREEDLGIEGLRKAKLSYYPALLVDKYTVAITPA